MVVALVYNLVAVFIPQMWTESLFVNLEFVACEKVMLVFESEVTEKIFLVSVMDVYLVFVFLNQLSPILFWWEYFWLTEVDS